MRLAFSDVGSGPVVVLLHGFPLNRAMWDAQIRALAPNHRVIAPDLPGHGESPAPDGVYTMDEMADAVVATLDELGVEGPVVVGGLSMGGYVALSMALNHQSRVGALVLADTRAAADTPAAAAKREETAQAVLRSGDVGPVVEGMLPRLFSQATFRERPGLVPPLKAAMEGTPPPGVVGALRGMACRPDRRERLKEISCPVLVAVGEDDAISPRDEMKAIADALGECRFVVVPAAGHLAPYENPDAFNSALLDFLRDFPLDA
ncbi:alpha/beta fold hydrolase [Paludisphaera sp.]|uniref:alpha/beta fold hydrolase n=1 Tax=Paludisphaera sp. TaxID=2017432 RepID=UPI00301CB811